MDRLKELSKIIQDANIELRAIHTMHKKEKNKKAIGRAFSNYVDDGDNHTDYYFVTSINEFGDLKCNKISIWTNFDGVERILFSKNIFMDDWIINEHEIVTEIFQEKWNNYLDELRNN